MSDEKKPYCVKTRDPIIQNFLDKKKNKSEAIEEILSDVLTGKLIPRGETGEGIAEKERLDIEYKTKRNEKLGKQIISIEIENRLKLIRQLHVSPSLAVEVAAGRVKVDEVIRPEPPKDSNGFDESGRCSHCGHVHMSEFAGGHCTASICNCGLRP